MANLSDEQTRRLAWARDEMNRGLHLVPEHLRDGLQRYIMEGGHVGQYLTALLDSDLLNVVGHGDDLSLAGLRGTVQFLHNYCPGGCWGSPAKRTAWQAKGGVQNHVA